MICKLLKNKIKLLLTLYMIVMVTSCGTYNVDVTKVDYYLVNKRSLKIHSLDCDVINLMSEHNKKEVHDSIEHLVDNGYIICEKCKAHKRQKFLGFIDNPFREKEYLIDLEDLPSRDEYLNAINEIGEWYINHVPTYQGKLSEEKLSDYEGKDKYYKKYNLKSKKVSMKYFTKESSKDYIVITSNDNENKIDELNANTDILKAKEEAIINYNNNYRKIDIKKHQAYYPCDYINDSKDNYKKAGDDCVRFFFTVMNSFDKEFTYRFNKITNKKWSQINTNLMFSNRNKIVKCMELNGFQVYDAYETNSEGIKINKIDENFKLIYGDIIVRDGHLHFYLGNDLGYSDNFGWGKVNRIFPQNYLFKIIKKDNYYFIVCDNDKTIEGEYRQYKRVYRYIGGPNESVKE